MPNAQLPDAQCPMPTPPPNQVQQWGCGALSALADGDQHCHSAVCNAARRTDRSGSGSSDGAGGGAGGGVHAILQAMAMHSAHVQVAQLGCAALAMLLLGEGGASVAQRAAAAREVVAYGGAVLAVRAMGRHKQLPVQLRCTKCRLGKGRCRKFNQPGHLWRPAGAGGGGAGDAARAQPSIVMEAAAAPAPAAQMKKARQKQKRDDGARPDESIVGSRCAVEWQPGEVHEGVIRNVDAEERKVRGLPQGLRSGAVAHDFLSSQHITSTARPRDAQHTATRHAA